jgi:hypothetical protein
MHAVTCGGWSARNNAILSVRVANTRQRRIQALGGNPLGSLEGRNHSAEPVGFCYPSQVEQHVTLNARSLAPSLPANLKSCVPTSLMQSMQAVQPILTPFCKNPLKMQPILTCTVPLETVFNLKRSLPENATVSSSIRGRPPTKNAEKRSTACSHCESCWSICSTRVCCD